MEKENDLTFREQLAIKILLVILRIVEAQSFRNGLCSEVQTEIQKLRDAL